MIRYQRFAAAMIGAFLIASCRASEEEQASPNIAANETAANLPAIPVADPPLDREALLLAVARAASAAAIGADDRARQRELGGKRFELRIRFGCPGQIDEQEQASRRWTFDEKARVLRFRVQPDFSEDSPTIESIAGSGFEAVEGFWLKQPWVLAAACPRMESQPPGEPGAEQSERSDAKSDATATEMPIWRVGIAQFFTATDTRARRRDGRAYEATRKLADDEVPSTGGYDLVLSGRLKQLPDGRVIACESQGEQRPPACIISAQFDRVRIEQAPTKRVLAEWGSG